MPFGNSNAESQRDSGLKAQVATHELPWESGSARASWRNSVVVENLPVSHQGSSFLATLGCETQSRWDCRTGGNLAFGERRSSSNWIARSSSGAAASKA